MANRGRLRLLIILLIFATVCLAATPTSFCKCSCKAYSKVIPLDDKASKTDEGKTKARSCAECNKQFCIDYNLPGCKGSTEADIFATCFQRDSTKDQLIVFIFIFVTAGLLIYAAAKPAVDRWQSARTSQQSYAPVDGQDASR